MRLFTGLVWLGRDVLAIKSWGKGEMWDAEAAVSKAQGRERTVCTFPDQKCFSTKARIVTMNQETLRLTAMLLY